MTVTYAHYIDRRLNPGEIRRINPDDIAEIFMMLPTTCAQLLGGSVAGRCWQAFALWSQPDIVGFEYPMTETVKRAVREVFTSLAQRDRVRGFGGFVVLEL